MGSRIAVAALVWTTAWCGTAMAADGPLGIDKKLTYADQGIWKRSNQKALAGVLIGIVERDQFQRIHGGMVVAVFEHERRDDCRCQRHVAAHQSAQ